ncbi:MULTISPECIES: tripartite tricarboxylate transporter substrate binding protein [unclassified Massilia]|uniref:Bug family tripartite tricarboxylate transporter substrate binding protein n=1 Tax=unclassified Massilia TaxID=2609279 RepID=UPI0017814D39|nr:MULTISPECIES: tripartite tricarboxylate transporter substrate binding protein [unclassified Massilia]MBD8530542.1 tripartite tricarboxylate transporter substrate binding protein [Massilia sp. CFBP 13647]MBD8674160.1 tripartite tricarboxylate transporter substrate binding protein [Massilia sp. CFBP 13721]
MKTTILQQTIRRAMLLGATGAALGTLVVPAWAQPVVTGPVKIVVPFTPGTTPDSVSRVIAPILAKRLGQATITDNRPGASGIIGMDMVAKAPPNGQTVMVGTNTSLTLPLFYKKVPFDVIKSFQPLGMIGTNNFALVVHPSVPASNPKELVAWIKANGATVNYASPGQGTLHHLTMEKFMHSTGVKVMHVPYKGSAGAISDVLGGHVKMMMMPLHLAMPLRADGKLKVIGSTRAERDPQYKDVVTLQEGGVAGFDEDSWLALWGPKGMPPALVAAYNAGLREALASPEVKDALAKQGLTLQPGSPDDLLKAANAEYQKWAVVVRNAQIKAE